MSDTLVTSKVSKSAAAWLTEGVLIVVSVALGFAVSQYGAERADRELARRALRGLVAEIEFNLSAVKAFVPFHKAHMAAMSRVDASGDVSAFGLYHQTRPPIPEGQEADLPLIRRAAWDAATSSGALRLIDYDIVAGLSEIYQMQDHLGAASARIPSGSKEFFDPADRAAVVRQTAAALNEMRWTEEFLVRLYEKQLPIVRAAAGVIP